MGFGIGEADREIEGDAVDEEVESIQQAEAIEGLDEVDFVKQDKAIEGYGVSSLRSLKSDEEEDSSDEMIKGRVMTGNELR